MNKNKRLSRRNFLKRSSCLTLASATAVNSIGLASLLNASTSMAAENDYKALVFIFMAEAYHPKWAYRS